MSFIRKIKRNGRIYLAEVENQRIDGKVKQKFIRYVGTKPSCEKNAFSTGHSNFSIDSVKLYGTVIVMDFLAKKIGLDKLLGEHAHSILALVYCHCHDYRSTLNVKKWFQKTDLGAIFKIDKITEKQLDSAFLALENMDQLALQKSIYENLMNLFPEEEKSSVVYDVTNTYFHGKCCQLGKSGKDKEGVKGRKIVQVGLAITKRSGFPIFHQVHPGNINDSKIFGEAIYLLKHFGISRGTIVYDRGMNAKTSILSLVNSHWKIIGGMPLHKGIKNHISEIDLNKLESYRNRVEQGETIFYVKTLPYSIGSVHGKIFLIVNPTKKLQDRERRLNKIKYYQQNNIEVDSSYKKFFSVSGAVNTHAIKRAEKYDGLSVIFSTGKESRENVLKIYFEKDVIEKSFQTLKGVLSLRPIRHWLGEKVKAHILICYLSYSLLTTFRFFLKNSKLGVSELTIHSALDELENIYRIYYRNHSNQKGDNPLFSKIITLSSLQEKILKSISSDLLL